jgi:hypothetical protein
MKLKVEANKLNVRIHDAQLIALTRGDSLTMSCPLGPTPAHDLRVTLRTHPDLQALEITWDNASLTLTIPTAQIMRWEDREQAHLSATWSAREGASVKISVELDRPELCTPQRATSSLGGKHPRAIQRRDDDDHEGEKIGHEAEIYDP